jgi:hypothetical protein
MKILSAYTHAKNCSNITGLQHGIQEIKDTVKERIQQDETIPHYFFVRLKKLEAKLLRMQEYKLPKTSINQIYGIRDKLDNLANSLQSKPSLKNEYTKYEKGEADYSIIGLLYVASAAIEEIIENIGIRVDFLPDFFLQ